MPPPHSPALRFGDAVSPIAKAKKTTGISVKLFKETPPACEWSKIMAIDILKVTAFGLNA